MGDLETKMQKYQEHFKMFSDASEAVKHNLWEKGLLTDTEYHEIRMGVFRAQGVLYDKWQDLRNKQLGIVLSTIEGV